MNAPAAAPAGPHRRGGRAATVLAALAASGVLVVLASRTWVVAVLPTGPSGAGQHLAVAGSQAAAAVPALGLVGLAAAAALSTLRGAGRVLASGLLAAAGLGAAAATTAVLASPAAAAADAARRASGLPGAAGASPTGWAAAALVAALAVAATGAAALLGGRRWSATSRFEVPSAAPGAAGPARPARAPGSRPPARSALWDELSAGHDPTAEPAPRPTGGPGSSG